MLYEYFLLIFGSHIPTPLIIFCRLFVDMQTFWLKLKMSILTIMQFLVVFFFAEIYFCYLLLKGRRKTRYF